MLLFFYNTIQLLLLTILGPVLPIFVALSPKYRGRIMRRLGWGLRDISIPSGRKIVWLHGLSVGELSSARPLIYALKRERPEIFLLLSTTTRGGERFAVDLAGVVDCQVAFPFDIYPVVRRFLRHIKPDIFILVETDFWPNFLWQLRRSACRTVLVNGRIAADSMRWYRLAAFFFQDIFAAFDLLGMQTAAGVEALGRLGIESHRLRALGNLKYDNLPAGGGVEGGTEFFLPSAATVLVAGSTHPGEEEMVFAAYKRLCREYDDLFLVVAPRDISRGRRLIRLAQDFAICPYLRSAGPRDMEPASVLILDTLGELVSLYGEADIVFLGGSLVDFGGHNPLEAAGLAKPVLYGPYMSDFQEISAELLEAGGALLAGSELELYERCAELLADRSLARAVGRRGEALVRERRGAARRYMEVICHMLDQEGER